MTGKQSIGILYIISATFQSTTRRCLVCQCISNDQISLTTYFEYSLYDIIFIYSCFVILNNEKNPIFEKTHLTLKGTKQAIPTITTIQPQRTLYLDW